MRKVFDSKTPPSQDNTVETYEESPEDLDLLIYGDSNIKKRRTEGAKHD